MPSLDESTSKVLTHSFLHASVFLFVVNTAMLLVEQIGLLPSLVSKSIEGTLTRTNQNSPPVQAGLSPLGHITIEITCYEGSPYSLTEAFIKDENLSLDDLERIVRGKKEAVHEHHSTWRTMGGNALFSFKNFQSLQFQCDF